MSAKKNKDAKSTINTSVNYTLENPNKITFDFLKTHLLSAADILRGSLDASEYRQPIMTILFLKRLNDTFEENAEKLVKKGKIVLNINLIKAPEQIIDYIIIHELCHLIIEGHSHKFWSLLHKYIPDYHEKVNWLTTNAEGLV